MLGDGVRVRIDIATTKNVKNVKNVIGRGDLARTANSVCGARIPQEAKIQFYVHATCARCMSAT